VAAARLSRASIWTTTRAANGRSQGNPWPALFRLRRVGRTLATGGNR
jgi:hypothetical protein